MAALIISMYLLRQIIHQLCSKIAVKGTSSSITGVGLFNILIIYIKVQNRGINI
jgi:hypothetical protein